MVAELDIPTDAAMAPATQPLVSVGLPNYNGERFLREALDSIVNQTYGNIEVIIVDNASNDVSPEICEEYAARDRRIRLFRSALNIGGFPNHNRVFALASGKYFVWASHDDLREPTHIESCVRELESDAGLVLCFTGVRHVGANGELLSSEQPSLYVDSPSASTRFADLISLGYGLEPIYGVIRSAVLGKTRLMGSYPDSDRVLLAELALHGPFCKLDEILFARRDHDERSITRFPSRYERIAWIEPKSAGKLVLPYWRQAFEYLRVICRAPLTMGERLSCSRAWLSWCLRHTHLLRSDILHVLRTVARRVRRRDGAATKSE